MAHCTSMSAFDLKKAGWVNYNLPGFSILLPPAQADYFWESLDGKASYLKSFPKL